MQVKKFPVPTEDQRVPRKKSDTLKPSLLSETSTNVSAYEGHSKHNWTIALQQIFFDESHFEENFN